MYIATDLSQLKTEEEVKKFMDDLCNYLDTNPKKLDFEELLSIRETYINHPVNLTKEVHYYFDFTLNEINPGIAMGGIV